jgi:hypothetical protein
MKKLHRQQIPIPFEVGQSYKTKFATGDTFTITRLDKNKYDEVLAIWGIYDRSPHLGECPIGVDRLIQPMEFTGVEFEVTVCPHCKHEFKE